MKDSGNLAALSRGNWCGLGSNGNLILQVASNTPVHDHESTEKGLPASHMTNARVKSLNDCQHEASKERNKVSNITDTRPTSRVTPQGRVNVLRFSLPSTRPPKWPTSRASLQFRCERNAE